VALNVTRGEENADHLGFQNPHELRAILPVPLWDSDRLQTSTERQMETGRNMLKVAMTTNEIKIAVRDYILKTFLPDESPESVGDDTELVTSGVLDSLGSLNLVSWLSETFGVEVEAHEVDVDHLNTINLITDLVKSKLG